MGWLAFIIAEEFHLAILENTQLHLGTVFEVRQPDNQKAAVETTGNYKSLQQESTGKQQIQNILITGCIQSKRGSSRSQQFHMY